MLASKCIRKKRMKNNRCRDGQEENKGVGRDGGGKEGQREEKWPRKGKWRCQFVRKRRKE